MEVDYETEVTIICPHCKKPSTHTVEGTTEVEPPERGDCIG